MDVMGLMMTHESMKTDLTNETDEKETNTCDDFGL